MLTSFDFKITHSHTHHPVSLPGELQMDSKSVERLLESSSGVHFSGFHSDELEPRMKENRQSTSSTTEHFHKQPFVIGLSSRS